MATMLIDGTKEIACRTAEADAIRAKTGDSAQIAYDFDNGKGFADAIEAIPSGVTEPWTSSSISYKWAFAVFPDNYDLDYDCSYLVSHFLGGKSQPPLLRNAFYDARQMKSITLRNLTRQPVGTSTQNEEIDMREFAYKDSYYSVYTDRLEEIHIPNFGILPQNLTDAFYGRAKLRIVDIVFDLSKIASYSGGYNFQRMFGGCVELEEVRFVPNSILWMNTAYQIFNVSQVLSDDSLVSIANGLAAGSDYPNLRLLSTPYARCSTLMGFVNSDNLFEANTSGDTSLADFITDVKGWTLYL